MQDFRKGGGSINNKGDVGHQHTKDMEALII